MPTPPPIETLTSYRTRDGRTFAKLPEAVAHAQQLEMERLVKTAASNWQVTVDDPTALATALIALGVRIPTASQEHLL